jgi:serine/threonine protein kinase
MTFVGNTSSFSLAADTGQKNRLLLTDQFTSEIRKRWEQGEYHDVATLLAKHPEIKQCRSLVLDLAHEEYCNRLATGESLDTGEFSRQFPSFQKSLYFLIEVHKLLDQDPYLRILQNDITWPQPGENFLGFSLLSELGRGTFARVFLATQPALGNRLVALKVALHGSSEAETLGKLKHPNIVPIYSITEDTKTGLTAICMPYLGRTTFSDLLDRAFLNDRLPKKARVIVDTIQDLNDEIDVLEMSSFHRILRDGLYDEGIIHLAIQLAEALEYTHSCGICHGDLKPSNVLLSLEGRPLLLDFNLSFEKNFHPSRIGGTLPYMAPEQLELVVLKKSEHAIRTSHQSDIFSLGVILYQLLSGDLPFGLIAGNSTVEQVAEQLIEEQAKGPCFLRKKNKYVDQRLAKVIHNCLTFDPARRPKTASDLIIELRKGLTPLRHSIRWFRHNPWLAGIITGILLLLLLIITSLMALRDPYSIRQFQSGLQNYRNGKYESAIKYFNESLRVNPKQHDAFFARGRTYQKLNNYLLAYKDFQESFRLCPTGETNACKGYCLNKLGYHREAIELYRTALSVGYQTPAVLNNLGYSYLKINIFDEANRYLEQTLAADNNLQSAHHTLIIVSISRVLDGHPLPKSAFEHARKAIELGPPTADLYFNVAILFAFAAKENPALSRPAIEYLDKAVEYGIDPKIIFSNPAFLALQEEQQFKQLLTKPAVKGPSVKSEYLIDPLGNQ